MSTNEREEYQEQKRKGSTKANEGIPGAERTKKRKGGGGIEEEQEKEEEKEEEEEEYEGK